MVVIFYLRPQAGFCCGMAPGWPDGGVVKTSNIAIDDMSMNALLIEEFPGCNYHYLLFAATTTDSGCVLLFPSWAWNYLQYAQGNSGGPWEWWKLYIARGEGKPGITSRGRGVSSTRSNLSFKSELIRDFCGFHGVMDPDPLMATNVMGNFAICQD